MIRMDLMIRMANYTHPILFFAKNTMAFMKLIIDNALKGGNQMAVLAIVCVAIIAICYVSTHQNEGK